MLAAMLLLSGGAKKAWGGGNFTILGAGGSSKSVPINAKQKGLWVF